MSLPVTKTKKHKSIWDKISNTIEKEFDENAADKGKFVKARRFINVSTAQ